MLFIFCISFYPGSFLGIWLGINDWVVIPLSRFLPIEFYRLSLLSLKTLKYFPS